jgi:hypothetical protein
MSPKILFAPVAPHTAVSLWLTVVRKLFREAMPPGEA